MTTHFQVFNAFILCSVQNKHQDYHQCATAFTKRILQTYTNIQQIKVSVLPLSRVMTSTHDEVRNTAITNMCPLVAKEFCFAKSEKANLFQTFSSPNTLCPIFNRSY